MAKTFLKANIPFNKIEHPAFKPFLERHTGKASPTESTLRKNYSQTIFNDTIQHVKRQLRDRDFNVMVDESTDVQGRAIA